MYKASQEEGAEASAQEPAANESDGAASANPNVVDADFEEVDPGKDKKDKKDKKDD